MAVDLPVVVTIKFNGKVLAERTSLLLSPGTTWEGVARQRLEAAPGVDADSFLCTPLTVSLFRTADALPSDRVAAAISDPVGAGYALGYAFRAQFHCAGAWLCKAGYRWQKPVHWDDGRCSASRDAARPAQSVQAEGWRHTGL